MPTTDKRFYHLTPGIGERVAVGQAEKNQRDSINLGRDNKALKSRQREMYDEFNQAYDALSGPGPTNPSRANFQTYPYDYFCGTNAKVFFGDVWVDDIVSIQYTVNQGKEPIYGYASQTFDAVARGTVIVQGSFSISFKEMGYLNVVQRLLEIQRQKASAAIEGVRGAATVGSARIQKKINEDAVNATGAKASINPRLAGTNFNGMQFSPTGEAQIIRSQETIEEILRYKKTGNIVASGLTSSLISPGGRERDFEDFAELLEDSIWGDSNGRPYAPVFKYRRPDEFDYTWDSVGEDAGGIRMAHGNDYSKVLNIMLTFGDINDFRAEHTLIVLNDVHIVSTAMIVSPTGEPIAETYTFFARDINQNISQEVIKNINPIKFEIGVPYELSKISDIDAIEKQLSREETPAGIEVSAISAFNESTGWVPQSEATIARVERVFELNRWEPLSDQIARQVETAVNDSSYSRADPSQTQYVVKVILASNASSTNTPLFPDLTMVLEQKIPNTLSYRVISPTRTNYLAPSVFTREDLWKDAKPAKVDTSEPPITTPESKLVTKPVAQVVEGSSIFKEIDPETGEPVYRVDQGGAVFNENIIVKEIVDPETGKITVIHQPSEGYVRGTDGAVYNARTQDQVDAIDEQIAFDEAYRNSNVRDRSKFDANQAEIDAEIAALQGQVELLEGKDKEYETRERDALDAAELERQRIEELKSEIFKTDIKTQVAQEETAALRGEQAERDRLAREQAAADKAKTDVKQTPTEFVGPPRPQVSDLNDLRAAPSKEDIVKYGIGNSELAVQDNTRAPTEMQRRVEAQLVQGKVAPDFTGPFAGGSSSGAGVSRAFEHETDRIKSKESGFFRRIGSVIANIFRREDDRQAVKLTAISSNQAGHAAPSVDFTVINPETGEKETILRAPVAGELTYIDNRTTGIATVGIKTQEGTIKLYSHADLLDGLQPGQTVPQGTPIAQYQPYWDQRGNRADHFHYEERILRRDGTIAGRFSEDQLQKDLAKDFRLKLIKNNPQTVGARNRELLLEE